jgi:hypothetical protein
MAGRSRFRALDVEMWRRTREALECVKGQPEPTPLEFAVEWLERPATLKALAMDVSVVLGFEVTYGRMMSYLAELAGGDAERDSKLDAARVRASHSYAEEAVDLLDAASTLPGDVAKAAAQAKSRQWMAERYNPARFGVQRGTNVHISIGNLHLDALKAFRPPALVSGDTINPATLVPPSNKSAAPQVEDAQEVSIEPCA